MLHEIFIMSELSRAQTMKMLSAYHWMKFWVDFLCKWNCAIPRQGYGLDWAVPFGIKPSRYPGRGHCFPRKCCRKEPGTKYMGKWYRNFRKFRSNREKSNSLEGLTFFPKIFHRNEPYPLNSTRNNRFFHTNGKRSFYVATSQSVCVNSVIARVHNRGGPATTIFVVVSTSC